MQVVVEWQPRGLAQLIKAKKSHTIGTTKEKQFHMAADTQKSSNCRDAATGVGVSRIRFGHPLGTTRLHTNPAFHENLSKSMAVYPSADAGIT